MPVFNVTAHLFVVVSFSQLLSAVLLLLRLWENGTREMDNERSTQGTSAPLLPLLQRFQNIHSSKEEPVPEEEAEVEFFFPPQLVCK